MDVDKLPASKGHGFFSLFDWGKSKKSKKRLFSGSGTESPTPSNTGDEQEVDGGAPSTPSNSILDDGQSLKESSEHSFSSSVIDNEAHPRRGPTVVARLMGLDSMPAASSSASYPMPLTVQRPFQNNDHEEMIGSGTSYVGSPSPHKIPGSPIDRFRMEALPPRFAKRTLSVAHNKLFSPVKNPNNISSRNAADIMEAASRIIGHGVENSSSYRVRDVGYTNFVHAFNPTEIVKVQQRSPTLNEAPKKRDGSASSKTMSGKPLYGSPKTSQSTATSRSSQSNEVGPRVKAITISSPDSRATNSQGSEGLSKRSRKVGTRRDTGRSTIERNGQNQQKNNTQMGMASSSSVLLQNRRKQNDMGVKHKVDSKPAGVSQQQSNMRSTSASPRKAGATITVAENSTRSNRKSELQPINYADRTLNSTAKNIPKPRRLPNGRMYSNKSQSSDKFFTDRSQRRVRHNIVVDDQSSFSTNKKKLCTEIVSFTFTSPVDKSLFGTQFPNHLVGKGPTQNVNSMSASSNMSMTKPDAIDGDYLGLLLEQKLRELTSGVRSPYCRPAKGVRIYAPSPVLEETSSACETSSITSTDCDRESLQSFKDEKAKLPQTYHASKIHQSFRSTKYDNDAIDQAELEHLHLSPHSTREASLSAETCSSVESWRSANETRLSSSTEGAATSVSRHYNRFGQADSLSEYSDTASSITVTAEEILPSESSSSCRMDYRQEIDFIREILNACSLDDSVACSDILDPNLLEVLHGSFSSALGQEDDKSSRMIRRLLFDCMNETLCVKCTYYFNAGYSSWFTGMAVLQKLSPEEIYQEMNSLKVSEEWMVDELVYREMGGPLGSWVDFKTESYEAGKDIAAELLGFFLDEIVADLVTYPLSHS